MMHDGVWVEPDEEPETCPRAGCDGELLESTTEEARFCYVCNTVWTRMPPLHFPRDYPPPKKQP